LQNVVVCRKYSLAKFENVVYFALRAEIATIVGPNVLAISARDTKVHKICQLCKAIFSAFYNISQPNFAILLISMHLPAGNI
jgi:hypothetical protein